MPGFSLAPSSDGEPLKPLTPSLSVLFSDAELHTALPQFLSPSVTYCCFQVGLDTVFETANKRIFHPHELPPSTTKEDYK